MQFEKQFESLDVQPAAAQRYLNACNASIHPSTPQLEKQFEDKDVQSAAAQQHLTAHRAALLLSPLQFEKQFESLDVQSEFVEQAMQNQAVLSTPEDDVNMLVQQVRRRSRRVGRTGAAGGQPVLRAGCESAAAGRCRGHCRCGRQRSWWCCCWDAAAAAPTA